MKKYVLFGLIAGGLLLNNTKTVAMDAATGPVTNQAKYCACFDVLARRLLPVSTLSIFTLEAQKEHPDVNAVDQDGRTLLLVAAEYFDVSAMRGALELDGVNVNARSKSGSTALFMVAMKALRCSRYGDQTFISPDITAAGIARVLLEHRANPQLTDTYYGLMPIEAAFPYIGCLLEETPEISRNYTAKRSLSDGISLGTLTLRANTADQKEVPCARFFVKRQRLLSCEFAADFFVRGDTSDCRTVYSTNAFVCLLAEYTTPRTIAE